MKFLRQIARSTKTLLLLSSAGAALCAGEGAATAPSQQLPIVHIKTDLQPIEVVVKDAQGNPVLGLSQGDFTVLENGKAQQIAFFDAGNAPASLVVLVDSASSVASDGRLGSAQAIAAQFLRTARPEDDMAAMDFTDQLGPYQSLTREQVHSPSVALAAAPGGGSALYDAAASTLCHLRGAKNLRQAVVVITNGVDQHSRITLEQLTGLVRSSRAQLFMIGLQTRPQFNFKGHLESKLTLVSGHDIDNPDVVFDRLMKESGAESFIPNSQNGLEAALKAVADTLPTQYTLAYYPQETSKTFRKIEVKVTRKGAHAFARRFVGTDQDAAESVHFEAGGCTVSAASHPYAFESHLTQSGAVYRDDFSDAKSGWPDHENSHYVPGGYELSNPKAKISQADPTAKNPLATSTMTTFRENVIAAYGPWWGDSRITATMSASLVPDPRDSTSQFPYALRPAAGLVFHLNQAGYYAVLISGAPGAKQFSLKLVKREFLGDSYVETDIFPWTEVGGAGLAPSAEISLEDVKNQISVFIDGQPVKSARDDTFDNGYAGFVLSGPGRATYKNLVVEKR